MQKFTISSRGGGSIVCIAGGTQRNERFEGHTSSLFRFFPKTKQKKQKKKKGNWFWHVRFGSSLFHKTFPPLPSLPETWVRTYALLPYPPVTAKSPETRWGGFCFDLSFFSFPALFLADWLTAEITVGGGDRGGEGIEVAVTRTTIYNYRRIYNNF